MFATHGFHSVRRSKIQSYLEIIQRYGTFDDNRYGPNAVVVFDGPFMVLHVKITSIVGEKEKLPRFLFDENQIALFDEQTFLANEGNLLNSVFNPMEMLIQILHRLH